MRLRPVRRGVSVGWTAVLVAACSVPLVAQSESVVSVSRTFDGRPDLSGVYQGGSMRPGTWEEANQGIGIAESAAPTASTVGAPGTVIGGAGETAIRRRPQYQAWAQELLTADNNSRNIDSATARCLPNPTFMTFGLFPVEFVQTPQQLIILIEYMGLFRQIPFNVSHPDDLEPTYLGHSVGRWEGDTLVVDTVGFNEQLHAGGGAGRMHSDALHMTERFTRIDANVVKYDAIWDDPKVLTAPDEIHTQFMRRPGTRIREFVCQENNQTPASFEKLKATGLHLRQK